MRRFLPVLVLVLMAPTVAELLWGSTPLSGVTLLLLQIPMYGCGALLIRELVRHRQRGWISILLLGGAYALIEEGLALQFLFHPTLLNISDWGGRVLGINGVYTVWAIGYHAIWSVALPILLTDLLFPEQRDVPYLGRTGLIITGIGFLFGVVLIGFIARVGIAPGYWASPLLLGGTVLVVLLLAWIALRVLPPAAPVATSVVQAPPGWVVALLGLVCGFLWQAILILFRAFFPALTQGPLVLVPLLVALGMAALVCWLLRIWTRASGWSDLDWLALGSGALIAHTIFGILFLTFTPLDKIGLAILGGVMVLLLSLFAVSLRRRARGTLLQRVRGPQEE
ncbi:hypothetical protein EI42_01066 [Thermosporothrix hazakensis]|jgi:hypothetical protein|uniref:Uncharacterized protein n=1 Tax=Thermosporothrix hazakensis TaxID=644383 RepID=A0A326UC27_THEHA|nr:hypothetical protein [Thermosporothrix hazakensis]PZW34229.1 hypothetical protein EI42_01066 [Thermosporothrix hazakensis]GCE46222.1 hypothetical protein KTH_10910 [Thermosporothrix hazakensis]